VSPRIPYFSHSEFKSLPFFFYLTQPCPLPVSPPCYQESRSFRCGKKKAPNFFFPQPLSSSLLAATSMVVGVFGEQIVGFRSPTSLFGFFGVGFFHFFFVSWGKTRGSPPPIFLPPPLSCRLFFCLSLDPIFFRQVTRRSIGSLLIFLTPPRFFF